MSARAIEISRRIEVVSERLKDRCQGKGMLGWIALKCLILNVCNQYPIGSVTWCADEIIFLL